LRNNPVKLGLYAQNVAVRWYVIHIKSALDAHARTTRFAMNAGAI
jgi:hypothetical protein